MKFDKLGLSKTLLAELDKAGFENPTEIQEKTIPLALAGKDIIGGSATGSGKTLAFGLPMIEKLTKDKIVSMSHPCGKYNSNTIKVLKNLEINTGFSNAVNSKFNFKSKKTNFLIPREDHINLINKI